MFEDPTSKLRSIQLPVIQQCYVNAMNCMMTKTMLCVRQTISVPLLLQ